MLFSPWMRLRKSSPARPRTARKRGAIRPRRDAKLYLERLEERLAPATLTVNSLADTVSGTSTSLDLREAILLVNSGGTATDSSGNSLSTAKGSQIDTSTGGFGTNDTIQFDPSLFSSTPQTITLGGSELPLTSNVIINGPGAGRLAVSGSNASRVFDVAGGVTASLSGLTIEDGSIGSGEGAGIYNLGTLSVSGCTISDNSAAFGPEPVGPFTTGGGIYNLRGTLMVNGSAFVRNSANYGGGFWNEGGTVTVSDCTLSDNTTTNMGGAIGNGGGGMLTVRDCTLCANTAGAFFGEGGGIANPGGGRSRSMVAPSPTTRPASAAASRVLGSGR